MTLDRQTKEALVERYSRTFAQSTNAIIVGYRGVTVPEVTELRAQVRQVGGRYEVVRNRLALLAMQDSALGGLASYFDGPTAVAYSDDDVVSLAKVLTEFAKEVPALECRAGLIEGSPVEADAIQQIAQLPSRHDLIAKLLFLLQSPMARLVRGLGAIVPQFVQVLDQIRQTKEAE